jgi:hypothetical protein
MLMTRHDPKIDRIASLAAFAGCSVRELRRIAATGTELDLPARRRLASRPAARGELVVLLEGTVELVDGESTVMTLGSGAVVGPVPPDAPESAFIRVGTDGATVLVFGPRELTTLSYDIASFASMLAAAPGFTAPPAPVDAFATSVASD